MKQDQMLILGIVMLVIFMVMMPTHMPTHKQQATISAADIKTYSDPNRVKECKNATCVDMAGYLVGPGLTRYEKENFKKTCRKKDSYCFGGNLEWGDCKKYCCSREGKYDPWSLSFYCT